MAKHINGETVEVEDTRKVGLNWMIAKNGRNRALWRKVVNPGSIKCDCGKVVSSNKAWDHVQGCEVAQEAFKKATELVKERARLAKELEENDKQAAGVPDANETVPGDNGGVHIPDTGESSEPGSIPS